jgi:hypothetical protein
MFFDNFRPEDIAACFEAQSNLDFEAKVAWRLETLLFRVTEATAFMIGDALRHQTLDCGKKASDCIFNCVVEASLDMLQIPQEDSPATTGAGSCVQLLNAAFEKCIEYVQLAQTPHQQQHVVAAEGGGEEGRDHAAESAQALYTEAEKTVAFAADSMSNAAFQHQHKRCVSRLDALVNFIANLHSLRNPKLVSLSKLLRNIAINGRYRSIVELLASDKQPLRLDAQNTSLLDVIYHLCDVEIIRNSTSYKTILPLAQQNRDQSTLLLEQVWPCSITLQQVCVRVVCDLLSHANCRKFWAANGT